MCGLVGVASTEGMKNRSARLNYMKMGLDIDSWRGWESTGLALVTEGSKDAPILYKRALNGRDFTQLKQVDKYLGDIEKYSVAIGHNRAATTGRGNIVDHNAHPFQYGHITLAHNGHIRNTHELKGAQQGAGCLVDSAHVAFAMAANGEKETLEQIEGGFCFVWWNSQTSLLNVARNTERPLQFAFAEGENTLYWASEPTQLLHFMKDIEIDEEIGMLFPKAWVWYQFNLKDLRSYTKVPFAKSQGWHSRQNQHTAGTAGSAAGMGTGTKPGTDVTGPQEWTDEELQELEDMYGGYGTRSTTSKEPITQTETSSDVVSLAKTVKQVAGQRLKDAKIAGVPTSAKRQKVAKDKLRSLGIDYNSLRNCTPLEWVKYSNQLHLGAALARTKNTGHLVEVLQVRKEVFDEYKKYGNLLVDCVNVRKGPDGSPRIVGTVSPRMAAFLERSKSQELLKQGDVKVLPGGSIERAYTGPDGVKITLAKFEELVTAGCVNCQRTINPKHHGAITWLGTPPVPVCPECAADDGIMELLGVPQIYRHSQVH